MDVVAPGEVLVHLLADVREGAVADVVDKRGQPDPAHVKIHTLLLRKALCEPAGDVRRAHAVLEPAVTRSGVHEVGERELLDPAKPLEGSGAHDIPLTLGERDEPVDGIPDLYASHVRIPVR